MSAVSNSSPIINDNTSAYQPRKNRKGLRVSFDETVWRRSPLSGDHITLVEELKTPRLTQEPCKAGAPFDEYGFEIEDLSCKSLPAKLPKSKPFPLPPKKSQPKVGDVWPNELRALYRAAHEKLQNQKRPITKMSLSTCMQKLNPQRVEKLRWEEMKELYARIAIDALSEKFKVKTPTGTAEKLNEKDKVKDLIVEIVDKHVEQKDIFKQMKVLLAPAGGGTINSISMRQNNVVRIAYRLFHTTLINKFIESLVVDTKDS